MKHYQEYQKKQTHDLPFYFLAHFFPSFTHTFLICSFCLFSLLEQLSGKKLNICFDGVVTHDQLKENKCSVKNFLMRSNPVLKVCCNFFFFELQFILFNFSFHFRHSLSVSLCANIITKTCNE